MSCKYKSNAFCPSQSADKAGGKKIDDTRVVQVSDRAAATAMTQLVCALPFKHKRSSNLFSSMTKAAPFVQLAPTAFFAHALLIFFPCRIILSNTSTPAFKTHGEFLNTKKKVQS